MGAREHYAVPRSLFQAGVLVELITDFWFTPANPAGRVLPRNLRDRFHSKLAGVTVKASNLSAISLEARHSVIGSKNWERIVCRNDWFQERALRELTRLAGRNPDREFCLFSFSYTARRLFRFAKSRGWSTVLGQIDAGPRGEQIIAGLHNEHSPWVGPWRQAPASYWQAWKEECQLADRVMVNSSWSREALIDEGIPEQKIRTIPLAYEAPLQAASFQRSYPSAFTNQRPLRVLFLGQITLGKGTGVILQALHLLQNEPVEFSFVGPRQMELSAEWLNNKQARWLGGVPRDETQRYYKEADVFLFPTFSDGFGLTQLEAQAWKLPIIASRFCGDVVRDGINGVLLKRVSANAIAETISSFVVDPGRLKSMSQNAIAVADFGIDQLASRLLGIVGS